jgi:hypothetical protein
MELELGAPFFSRNSRVSNDTKKSYQNKYTKGMNPTPNTLIDKQLFRIVGFSSSKKHAHQKIQKRN